MLKVFEICFGMMSFQLKMPNYGQMRHETRQKLLNLSYSTFYKSMKSSNLYM